MKADDGITAEALTAETISKADVIDLFFKLT